MSTHLDVDGSDDWYTYEFARKSHVRCALGPACEVDHPMYIGKTNEPWRRHFEHLRDKGWIDDSSGYTIHEETYGTEAEALAAELAMIHARLPLANKAGNENNRHRLVWPEFRARRSPARRQAAVRPRTTRPDVHAWSPRQRKHLALTGTWATLSAAGWWSATTYLGLSGWHAPLAGAVAAAALMAVVGVAAAEVRAEWNSRRARRQRRRLVRRVTALTVAAAVAGLLYLTGPALLAHLPAQAR